MVGYHTRTHIAKSLQTRSKAIRNAVKQYNAVALTLDRPTLDWAKVTHYSFLDEFNLLRDNNVNQKPWADPVIRETMRKYQRLQRAKEELIRCNIEVRRLHTSIVDEHRTFNDLAVTGPLNGEIHEFVSRRKAVNSLLIARIKQIYSLPGFTGVPSPGVRKGHVVPDPLPDTSTDAIDLSDDDVDDGLDDALLGDIGGLVEYVSNLT